MLIKLFVLRLLGLLVAFTILVLFFQKRCLKISNKMETWKKTSLLLCVFGFLKEFRPSEPYITPYLEGPPMNFTDEQVDLTIQSIILYKCTYLLYYQLTEQIERLVFAVSYLKLLT